MEHEQSAQIVIGPDGTVLAATGPVPPGLVDARLEDCQHLSQEVRQAGHALLKELRGSGHRVAIRTVALDDGNRRVQLVAIEALAIRRAATDLRTLLPSKLAVIVSQAAEVDVTLSIVVDSGMPSVVHVDPEKVAWSITTLVGNALRYMRMGSQRSRAGKITVHAGFDPTRSEVTIEVQDNGPGVPDDTVTRLFRRDGLNVRGAGLALLMMHDICVAHGGTADVHSRTDTAEHGTTVRLTFAAR